MITSLLLLAGGWAAFGALHSLVVESRVRAIMRLPAPLVRAYRLAYNTLTAAGIAALIAYAVSLESATVYEVRGPLAAFFHVLRAVGAVIGLASAWQLGFLEFVGIAQLLGRARAPAAGLKTDGLYSLCRHPMGLGFLLMLWGSPRMSAAYLVTAATLTAYLLVGSWLEERDLLARFPADYAAYRRRVPSLLPVPRRVTRQASVERAE